MAKNTPAASPNEEQLTKENQNPSADNKSPELTLEEREAAVEAREKAVGLRESSASEKEKFLDEKEAALEAKFSETASPEETPGEEFKFEGVDYKFADHAPKTILLNGKGRTQKEIAKDKELIVLLLPYGLKSGQIIKNIKDA